MNIELLYREGVSEGLKKIRHQRRLNQKECARLLGLSQAQFSKIENAQSSLTAEQLLFLLNYFNLPLSYFIKTQNVQSMNDESVALQNALIRLGANHLVEKQNVFVPESFNNINEVIFQVLAIYPSARLITGLAPVFVKSFNKINFLHIENKLLEKNGCVNRLWWFVESALQSIEKRLKQPVSYRKLVSQYRRAQVLLFSQLQFKLNRIQKVESLPEDILDTSVGSEKTLHLVRDQRDKLAKKWSVVTGIKLSDFEDALKQAEEYD